MGPAIVTRTGIRDEQQGTTNTIPLSEKVKQPSQVRVHRPPADRIEPILYYLTSAAIAGGHGSDKWYQIHGPGQPALQFLVSIPPRSNSPYRQFRPAPLGIHSIPVSTATRRLALPRHHPLPLGTPLRSVDWHPGVSCRISELGILRVVCNSSGAAANISTLVRGFRRSTTAIRQSG